MATWYDGIDDRRRAFIEAQHVFFVATAAPEGRVNVSPKGLDSLRVLGADRVLWLNGTGSGNETAAHLLRNPRITMMFCSFDREPLILRLFGTATMTQPDDPDWPALSSYFPPMPGARQVYDVRVESVLTSCGYGVPLMSFDADRPLMHQWAEKKIAAGALTDYQLANNAHSIDGFPTALPD